MHFAPLGVIDINNPCNDPDPGAQSPPPCNVQLGAPNVVPDQQLQNISNGLTWLTLMAALVAMLAAMALLAVAQRTDNPNVSFNARRGAIASVITAVFVGALPHIITFWVNAASR